MKKLLCFISILSLLTASSLAATVPAGTEIVLGLKRHKSQRTMHSKLNAIVKKDVYVNDKLVFAKNSKAEIYILKNKKARFFGRGGTLILSDGIVYDVNGSAHDVEILEQYTGKNTPFIAKFLIFKKGQNVVIYPSQDFVVKLSQKFKI